MVSVGLEDVGGHLNVCFAPVGATYKWLKHSPIEVINDRHQNESIFVTNISNHFEIVKKL